MRRKEDRTNRILELLVKEKKLEVTELSASGIEVITPDGELD
jgi:DeoR/GlpR family transcriptional regulator of sugar metabolism